MKPIVSIIIPNYNSERYVADALQSVSAQTEKNWECIVIDDASTDNSVKTIKKHIRGDKRFKLIQLKEKSGVSVARNAGLDAARGKYIAFLDSDDCYADTTLELLIQLIETTGADMAGGRSHLVNSDFKFKPNPRATYSIENFALSHSPTQFLLLPKRFNWCWIWRRIYKRELIGSTRFLPEFTGLGEDLTFMLDISHRAKSIAECTNICVYHRVHQNNVTRQKFSSDSFNWFPTYFKHMHDNLLDRYPTSFWKRFYQDQFRYLITETIIRPKVHNTAQAEAKQTIIESCKYIPRRYLRFKQRMLCRLLSCLK